MKVKVGSGAELPPGARRIIDVDGKSIGVFNLDGSYYALSNECTHSGGPVCTGKIMPLLTAHVLESGEVEERLSAVESTISCPWHGWEFNLKSGACLANPRKSLPTYAVSVEDGDIYVEV